MGPVARHSLDAGGAADARSHEMVQRLSLVEFNNGPRHADHPGGHPENL